MSFALLGSLLCALTLLPVLCSYLLRRQLHEPRASALRTNPRRLWRDCWGGACAIACLDGRSVWRFLRRRCC